VGGITVVKELFFASFPMDEPYLLLAAAYVELTPGYLRQLECLGVALKEPHPKVFFPNDVHGNIVDMTRHL
jgi:hypothetical protein